MVLDITRGHIPVPKHTIPLVVTLVGRCSSSHGNSEVLVLTRHGPRPTPEEDGSHSDRLEFTILVPHDNWMYTHRFDKDVEFEISYLEGIGWLATVTGAFQFSHPLFVMAEVRRTYNVRKMGSLSMNMVSVMDNVAWVGGQCLWTMWRRG